jgi:molecular chaperone IbpA
MNTFDPVHASRFVIGIDRFIKLLDRATSDEASVNAGYPPHNIERLGEDQYRITLALAGFKRDDVEITVTNGLLEIKGEQKNQASTSEILYRGIAARAFEKSFKLADYVEVKSASFEHGLLQIDLVREVPEAKKPRRIDISDVAA